MVVAATRPSTNSEMMLKRVAIRYNKTDMGVSRGVLSLMGGAASIVTTIE